jgi:16S rRNA (cytosine1402-N4)-methyltransferase
MRHNTAGEGAEAGYHFPVLWREILGFAEGRAGRPGALLADCTLGEGGHSSILLKEFPGLKIAGIDRDPEIMERAAARLSGYGERINFVNTNFAGLGDRLAEYGEFDMFLFDFGISSFHYESSGRGFAFSKDEPLDMRLDGTGISAFDIVNGYRERDLADVIYKYGEERWGGKIAAAVRRAREIKPVETTAELADIVLSAIPAKFRVKNIHPATRVFQALRIEANGELEAISDGLNAAWGLLKKGGLIMAISFHSLEDRIVKRFFKALADGCSCGMPPKKCACARVPEVKILTGKPVLPADDETALNSRSRSAKLRVCEKI